MKFKDERTNKHHLLPGVELEIYGVLGSLLNAGVTGYAGRFASGID